MKFVIVKYFGFVILFVLFFSACDKSNESKLYEKWIQNRKLIGLCNIYPQSGAVFPPELPPVTFNWNDTSGNADSWVVFIGNRGEIARSEILKQCSWQPDSTIWINIKNNSINKKVDVVILGFNSSNPEILLSSAITSFSTSSDSVGYPIFYRTVPLPFSFAVDHTDFISWRLGEVSSSAEPPIALEKLPVCGNCHSFSADGKTLGLDTDYGNDKGSYAIAQSERHINLSPDKIITWSDYKRDDGENTFGLLSQVSPDGRFVASTVKDRSIFVPIDNLEYSQLFFPIKGIIVIYDRMLKKFTSLPGADNPKYVQSNPVWSPDGKYLLFARTDYFKSPEAENSKKAVLPASVAKEFIERKRSFKYDIYKIPFNEGKGGVAEPLTGAYGDGSSNYFPKISPDGKWVVFCKADNFMLLQKDSKLYIIPAAGGEARKMNCNNSEMNSWHSWSPNGKWLVFASKQRGAFTQLYLTHINADGTDSPPVLLEHFSIKGLAANIPEFVNIKPGEIEKITESFLNTSNYALFTGIKLLKQSSFEKALEQLNTAVSADPKNSSVYYYRALAFRYIGNIEKSTADLNQSIALNGSNPDAYFERGFNFIESGNFKASISDFNSAIKLNPKYLMAYYERGVAYYNMGKWQDAINDNNKVIELDKNAKYSYFQRGLCLAELNRINEACADFRRASELGCVEAAGAIQELCR